MQYLDTSGDTTGDAYARGLSYAAVGSYRGGMQLWVNAVQTLAPVTIAIASLNDTHE